VKQQFSANRSSTVPYAMLLGMLSLCTVPATYWLSEVRSSSCGPIRGLSMVRFTLVLRFPVESSSGEQQSVAAPRPREDGLAHHADPSRTNLACALWSPFFLRLSNLNPHPDPTITRPLRRTPGDEYAPCDVRQRHGVF
jgi:hypothetical protein